MNIKKRVIFNISFNDWGSDPKILSQTWINYRIAIFMKFTLQSLKKQTNPDFTAFIKYNDRTEKKIMSALSRYEQLPDHIRFVKNSEYDRHILKNLEQYDYLYIVRIDSDDLYHKSFIQQIHDHKPNGKAVALIVQQGYLYDSIRNRMAAVRRISPPFYTFIYKTVDYIKGERYKPKGGHLAVIRYPHEIIKNRNFMFVIHGNNDSSKFTLNKRCDSMIPSKDISTLLDKFM